MTQHKSSEFAEICAHKLAQAVMNNLALTQLLLAALCDRRHSSPQLVSPSFLSTRVIFWVAVRAATRHRQAVHEIAERLEDLVNRPGVTDVVIGPNGAWCDNGRGFERVAGWSFSEHEHRALAFKLIDRGGRHIDVATPFADVRLDGGLRVHAVLPPASCAGTVISVRVPTDVPPRLERLVELGLMTVSESAELESRARAGRSFLVAGATGTGKTTLAAAILASLPDNLRIITVEDVAELRVDHPHVVSLECRQANIEGAGAIGLGDLVRQTLRMRPDRIVVGEMRGAEVLEAMLAHNSGHAGGSTVHAGSLAAVAARLESLGALAGLSPTQLAAQAVSAFDDVYFLTRTDAGRRLTGIGSLGLDAVGRLRCDSN